MEWGRKRILKWQRITKNYHVVMPFRQRTFEESYDMNEEVTILLWVARESIGWPRKHLWRDNPYAEIWAVWRPEGKKALGSWHKGPKVGASSCGWMPPICHRKCRLKIFPFIRSEETWIDIFCYSAVYYMLAI